MSESSSAKGLRLHWLPAILAVVPLAVVHACHWINASLGLLPACLPYLQGCLSISAAARYPPANYLFDALMTPMGVVLAAFWMLQSRWMVHFRGSSRMASAVFYCGLAAGILMVCYAVFLGVETPAGRLLRRIGINGYLLFNASAQIMTAVWLSRGDLQIAPDRTDRKFDAVAPGTGVLSRTLAQLCAVAVGVGFLSLAENLLPADNNIIDNIIQWNFALLSSLQFVIMSILWWRSEFRMTLSARENCA